MKVIDNFFEENPKTISGFLILLVGFTLGCGYMLGTIGICFHCDKIDTSNSLIVKAYAGGFEDAKAIYEENYTKLGLTGKDQVLELKKCIEKVKP